MKAKIIFLLFSFILCNIIYAFAQEDDIYFSSGKRNKKEIEYKGDPYHGWVFIDGKYIDAPYKVKRKGLDIYINGVKTISYEEQYKQENTNPFNYDKRPEIPTILNTNSTIEDLYKTTDSYKKIPILNTTNYFFKYYEFEQAIDSVLQFIKSMPNVKSIEATDGEFYKITLFNGEETSILIGGINARRKSEKWGPNGTGGIKESIYIGNLDYKAKELTYYLNENNSLLIYFTGYKPSNNMLICGRTDFYMSYIHRIMHYDITDIMKRDSLKVIFKDNDKIKIFIENFKVTPQYNDRINNAGYDTLNTDTEIKSKTEHMLKNGNYNSSKSVNVFSPDHKEIYAWCPYIWDDNFSNFITEELYKVKENIIYEDYIYNQQNIYTDDTPNDDDIEFGDCTYSNFKNNMTNAGFLYLSTHGSSNGSLLIQIASDQTSLEYWCDYDPIRYTFCKKQ